VPRPAGAARPLAHKLQQPRSQGEGARERKRGLEAAIGLRPSVQRRQAPEMAQMLMAFDRMNI